MRRAVWIISIVALVVSLFGGCSSSSANNTGAQRMEYEGKLMDDSYVHDIDIEIPDADWKELLENPLEKTKYKVDVTIDGETFSEVSFATKGNTSLSQIAGDDSSDRYSFKVNFGKYVDGQSYYGLDKLNLNNIMSDTTYMKDYLSYEIMAEAGAAAPLASFVNIRINGEAWGLYLAVEDVSDSFIARNYGEAQGELYKPETEQLNNAGKGQNGMNPPQGKPAQISGGAIGERPEMPQENLTTGGGMQAPFNGQNGGNRDGFGGSSKGASLAYTDDELDSYSDIFDNAETEATEEDMKRVVAALKQLSTGENLESCLDVDAVIKYFAAHNFVDNYDSYTGNMLHNYYLYENNGLLSVIPWDYNLAFGSFGGVRGMRMPEQQAEEKNTQVMDDAAAMVNYAIDTPLSGAEEKDRPLWSAIINNEEYKELYHKYLDQLITSYFESGKFEEKITSVYEMIRPYVEKDATAFYTVEEFDKAYSTLKTFCTLRAESIRKQLDGEIPATTQEQQKDGVQLVDASSISLQAMGSQGGGGLRQNPDENKK
ncbi:MAG: spore coat protein CotH [Clostridiales bacterium]|uniref:CotH kinase family protein n=1 Tax=Aminipila sp. TaxID=2060095 RepID=UPI001D202442|nr:CotH kinase family protein [Aminipila sp.]MBE6034723.1 spore coat protein CotH [Clostridiales bacterium]